MPNSIALNRMSNVLGATALSVEGVRVVLGAFELGPITFAVPRGKTCILVGRSGGGKSTLLRVLAGIQCIDSGTATFAQATLAQATLAPLSGGATSTSLRTPIPLVFQEFQLWPHLTVLKNVSLAPQRVLGCTQQEANGDARILLDEVGLGEKLDSYPETLSGGEAQRVALARALAVKPELLLLDEITSALDPWNTNIILNTLRRHCRAGLCIVAASHDREFTTELGDIVLHLNNGKLTPCASFDDAWVEGSC